MRENQFVKFEKEPQRANSVNLEDKARRYVELGDGFMSTLGNSPLASEAFSILLRSMKGEVLHCLWGANCISIAYMDFKIKFLHFGGVLNEE